MKAYFSNLPRVLVGRRNESYRESLKLALFNGIVWAPMTLWEALKAPLLSIAFGLFGVAAALFIFVSLRFVVLGFGLAGYLTFSGWGHYDDEASEAAE